MAFKRPLSISPSPSEINDNTCSTKPNTCKICGDEGHIINYGALSCQSCKTFFRRNGFRPEVVRPCPYDGQCEVNMLTRTVCTACRLRKCFTVGMSSDLIRKELRHVKRNSSSTKYKTIMPVSQLPTLDLVQNDRSSLATSQWTLFSNILHAFDTFSVIPTLHRLLKNLSSSPSEVRFEANDALETIGSMYTSMQAFVKSIPDFQVLSINEQQSLFQRNLHGISGFYADIVLRDTSLLDNRQCFDTYVVVYGLKIMQQTKDFLNQLDPDSNLLKLILIIMVFSPNSYIVDVHENMSNDSLIFATFRLYGSQNVYVELLWKYMLYRYGYCDTVLHFNKLVKHILDMIKIAAVVYVSHAIHHDYIDHIVEKTKEKLIISQNDLIPLWGKELSSS